MENINDDNALKVDEKVGEGIEQNASKWAELVKELVDKLTGKDMAVTYEFSNLEIDMPKASGPGGKELGSAKWKINGKFVISTELHDKYKTME
jgi:hypothetical protein